MLFWHVPAPNEALLISGSKRRRDDTQFRIVTGHGALVVPVKQKARLLSLALREAEIVEDCITQQGIRLNVRAVAAFKVGDDPVSIANAARRFLSEQDQMEVLVGRVFAGHLRSIIGGLTVEQIIRERDRVAQEVKDGSHAEMEKLGIVVDALEIQEIEDASGYINNLAAPHAAVVASQARIASAQADQEAAQRELEVAAMKAQYERDTEIRRPATWPRPSRPGRGRPRLARWLEPRRRRRLSSSRPRSPERRPTWPRSAWRPRYAGRLTPRPTASARSPRRIAIRPSRPLKPTPSASARSPKLTATRPSSRPRPRPTATPRLRRPRPRQSKLQADAAAYAERTTAQGDADAIEARATARSARATRS